MGGDHSKDFEELRLGSDWQKNGEEDGVTLVRNKSSGVEGEMRIIVGNPRSPQDKQLQIYNYRRTQDEAQVITYAVEVLPSKNVGMCGSEQEYKVITERIIRRLDELPQLTLKQSLYILSECLRGYRDLYERVGSFQVTWKMIGVNSKGKVKVWLNQNFAQNHPVIQRPVLQITSVKSRQGLGGHQAYMVRQIFQVVEEKCEDGRFPKDFRSRIIKKDNFEDVYWEVEKYCQQNKFWIPDKIVLNPTVTPSKGINQVESVHLIRQPQLQPQNVPSLDRDTFIRKTNPREQESIDIPAINYQFSQRATSPPQGSFQPQSYTGGLTSKYGHF